PPPAIGDERIETDDGPGPPGENQSADPCPERDGAFAVAFGDARFEPVDPLPRNPAPPPGRADSLFVLPGLNPTSAVEEWSLGSRAVSWRRRHDTSGGKFRSASVVVSVRLRPFDFAQGVLSIVEGRHGCGGQGLAGP